MMNGVGRGFATLACVTALVGLGQAGEAAASQEGPIDRWLVARAAAPDTMAVGARLSTDLLAAPGQTGVLPDRGMPAAGVIWTLLRQDGESSVQLDSVFSGGDPGTVVYAHTYIRLPRDRTLRLQWRGLECTTASAWLNGREISATSIDARFGAGWNTLLLKLVAGECAFGYRATLAAAGAGDAGEIDARVQASRPPGDIRTGPDDWVVAYDTVRVAPERRWRGNELYAGLVVGLTAWGRAAVSDVELELRDGADGRATAPWLVPGRSEEIVIPVRLDRLNPLVSSRRAALRIRWAGEQIERSVHVAGVAPRASDRIALGGWTIRRSTERAAEGPIAGRLPTAGGWRLEGRWKVPEALDGRTLLLDSRPAPADYVLNGSPMRGQEDGLTLCSPCRRGVELRLVATSTAPWSDLPLVRVGEDGAEG